MRTVLAGAGRIAAAHLFERSLFLPVSCSRHWRHPPGRLCRHLRRAGQLRGRGEKAGDTEGPPLRGVEALLVQCREMVIVSNEVFTGGSDYEGDTLRYLRILADINRAMAARADNVAEIVCGQAVYYKGKEPAP